MERKKIKSQKKKDNKRGEEIRRQKRRTNLQYLKNSQLHGIYYMSRKYLRVCYIYEIFFRVYDFYLKII